MEAGHEGKIEGDRALVEALRDQARYCMEHLDTRREVLKEHWHLLAGLTERVPELDASVEPPNLLGAARSLLRSMRRSRLALFLQGAVNSSGRLSARPLVEKDVG